MKGIEKFIDFYGGLTESEVSGIVILARKKYDDRIKKREKNILFVPLIGELWPDDIVNIIRSKINPLIDGEVYTNEGKKVPLRALSFNIVADPRTVESVAREYTKHTMNLFVDSKFRNIIEIEKNMRRAVSRGTPTKRHYFIDIDVSGKEGLKIARDIAKSLSTSYAILETYGGYHVLLKWDSSRLQNIEYIKNKYLGYDISFNNGWLVALPDTPRGGTTVRLVEIYR